MKYLSDRMTSASGSIGGTVFSHNKGGMYTRARRIPTNPSTVRQVAVRTQLSNNSQAWKNLTDAQRLAWNQTAPNFPLINALGMSTLQSGKGLFVQLNNNLALVGLPGILVPPANISPDSLECFNLVIDTTAGDYDLNFTPVPGSTDKVFLSASVGVSPGISYSKNLFRYVKTEGMAVGTSFDFDAEYLSTFGVLAPVGTKVFASVMVVSSDSGVASSIQKFSSIAV